MGVSLSCWHWAKVPSRKLLRSSRLISTWLVTSGVCMADCNSARSQDQLQLRFQGIAAVAAINVSVVKGGDALVQADFDVAQDGLGGGSGVVGQAPGAVNQAAEGRQAGVHVAGGDQRRTPWPSGVAGV